MYVVAVGAVAGDLQTGAARLAAALGCAEYDVRTRLGGVLPAIVFRSSVEADAARALAAVRAEGHGALIVDTREVIASFAMVDMHRFQFDEVFLFTDSARQRWLAFADIGAILVVGTRTSVIRATMEEETVSRGIRHSVTVRREHKTSEQVLERAAYVYPLDEDGQLQCPWVLREKNAQFLALGPALRRTRHENFQATVDLLRERAPGAAHDDRYLTSPRLASELVQVRDRDTAPGAAADAGVDLSIHLLARWLLRPTGGPYRAAPWPGRG
jgi:hypothetical protein